MSDWVRFYEKRPTIDDSGSVIEVRGINGFTAKCYWVFKSTKMRSGWFSFVDSDKVFDSPYEWRVI